MYQRPLSHDRPSDDDLEAAPVVALITEVRYLRHLIRSVDGCARLRIAAPSLRVAWKSEARLAQGEGGLLCEWLLEAGCLLDRDPV